ncbi:uncharacterized protein LOC118470620 [Amphiprion ocellaris]|uniref:uncharacterized protein LOC118470620 n=1 Tax=Amphiprion ocellaris TaxID=80972 RepID=UPI001649D951|nr:uncharacterized protein LOC118470620 [Amphiprion ocellaris]
MKLVVFTCLLAVVSFMAEGSTCIGKTVEVWVTNGIGLTGDGLADPDPYVLVQIDGKTQRTRVIHSNSNPGWWQTFRFYSPSTNFMRIEVWEKDGGLRGDDDHLGTCVEDMVSQGNRFQHIQCTVKDGGVVKLLYKCT